MHIYCMSCLCYEHDVRLSVDCDHIVQQKLNSPRQDRLVSLLLFWPAVAQNGQAGFRDGLAVLGLA